MRVSIERLRVWVLALAGLLLASLIFFFVYARWQVRRIARDLPGKLGISIQQSTNGFTVSKSHGGHTIFTLHAAKMVQYKGGGQAELHDVSIALYGEDGKPSDYIYGNNFSYDPSGVVRANGEVQIDLQGLPHPASPPADAAASEDSDGKNIVHVKTSDLLFDQKTGQASTQQRIDFRVSQAAGSATGASFDSRSGMLVLDKDVVFNSSLNGKPLLVRASHAQYNRAGELLYLFDDITEYLHSRSASNRATVYFRSDGSAQRVDADGNVTIDNDGRKIVSSRGHVGLDRRSEPEEAILGGGVTYTADTAGSRMHGTAGSGTLSFGPNVSLRHAEMSNAVSLVDEEKPFAGAGGAAHPAQWSTRNVEASQVDVDFSPAHGKRAVAKNVLAIGDAKLHIRTFSAGAAAKVTPAQNTSVEGDRLLATLKDGSVLSTLRGVGHTVLVETGQNGVTQKSTGDNLFMTFVPAPVPVPVPTAGAVSGKRAAKPAPKITRQSTQIASAEQEGNVTFHQQNRSGGSAPSEVTARGQKATYDAASQRIKLVGNPRVDDPDGEVTANVVEIERLTGNATATGNVKLTYRQSGGQVQTSGFNLGGSEPVHVTASRALFDHAKGLDLFYGGTGEPARLWQGADSVTAPVIELSSSRKTLFAHGAEGSGANTVNTVFAGGEKSAPASNAGHGSGQTSQTVHTSVVRVGSQTLSYSDDENKGVFRGGVLAQDPSASIRSDGMDVYLGPAGGFSLTSGSGVQGQPKSAREVERIVAEGNVRIEEPGRRGTGEKLIYMVQDGNSILTGTSSAPPRMVDQAHGSVTGASLIFNNRDDSVIVSGGQSKAITETRTAK